MAMPGCVCPPSLLGAASQGVLTGHFRRRASPTGGRGGARGAAPSAGGGWGAVVGDGAAGCLVDAFSPYGSIGGDELPIVYSPQYNIRFLGIEKLHPFDSCKYEKVVAGLAAGGAVDAGRLARPVEAAERQLLEVHTPEYLATLRSARNVAEVAELPPLAYLPGGLVDARVLRPMRYMAAGTVLAAGQALLRGGLAVNLGGGFHHASAGAGGGWCAYGDLQLATRVARGSGLVRRVLVIDLDAHQGNGVSRDKAARADEDLFIVDAYREGIYPMDAAAERGVNIAVRLAAGTGDGEYLERVAAALEEAAGRFGRPDLILYNAGTDVLAGDPLGDAGVSAEGVRRRDETVVQFARGLGAPVAMVLSGGYTRESAGVIVESVGNLVRRFVQ